MSIYPCIVNQLKQLTMEKLVTIYEKINVNSISYEKGDSEAQINCQLEFKNKSIQTKLIISQSDLNRIISKITANGYELNSEDITSLSLGDGTEIVEYDFTGSNHTLYNFHFNNNFKQIGA